MANRAHIQYKGDPKVLLKDLRPEVKAALQETVNDWHDNTLPVHFTDTGRRRWKYRPRTRKYRRAKRRSYGHNKPLVKTGDLRRRTIRRAKTTGSSKSARVTMNAPWYATKRFGGHDTYADEITAVTLGESRVMAKDMQKRMEIRLNKIKNSAPKTIKR